jgi:hypothetical protein
MSEQQESDLALVAPLDGLHLGSLTATELSALSRLVVAGLADRDYSGPGGFLGLGKVRMLPRETVSA